MIPKGAMIGLGVGVVGAIVIGLFFANLANQAPTLVYVEGSSLSIITEKTNFELGEPINIRIINSGTEPLAFSDSSYGMKIVGLDSRILYSPQSLQIISVLEPKEEKMFVWDQTKSDGDKIIDGRYKIVSSAIAGGKNVLTKSLTINVLK
ncbi:MAG TPA: hypothetical protein VJJ01_00165 [Nitrosopumilaceae archaeon]|nr:hypothetical protein [Nitrosopumilaceae archaeon]